MGTIEISVTRPVPDGSRPSYVWHAPDEKRVEDMPRWQVWGDDDALARTAVRAAVEQVYPDVDARIVWPDRPGSP